MIKPLPHWVLTNEYPAFYDTESVTAIEMVAKLYGSMEELITDYNAFVDNVNQTIADFESGIITDFNDFKDLITQMVEDYIATIDGKFAEQDETIADAIADQNAIIAEQNQAIADAIAYMKDNIVQTATTLFNQFLEEGDVYVSLATDYDESLESLTLGISVNRSNELLEDLSELATVEEGE